MVWASAGGEGRVEQSVVCVYDFMWPRHAVRLLLVMQSAYNTLFAAKHAESQSRNIQLVITLSVLACTYAAVCYGSYLIPLLQSRVLFCTHTSSCWWFSLYPILFAAVCCTVCYYSGLCTTTVPFILCIGITGSWHR